MLIVEKLRSTKKKKKLSIYLPHDNITLQSSFVHIFVFLYLYIIDNMWK